MNDPEKKAEIEKMLKESGTGKEQSHKQ